MARRVWLYLSPETKSSITTLNSVNVRDGCSVFVTEMLNLPPEAEEEEEEEEEEEVCFGLHWEMAFT